MGHLLAELRQALRGLAARPGFALVAVLSLAVGIGTSTAIWSLYHQVALKPMAVDAPERLVNLSGPGPKSGSSSSGSAGDRDDVFSYPMFRDLQRLQEPFAGIAGHVERAVNIGHGGRTTSGSAMLVSGNYFALLGLQPSAGRLIAPHDDQAPGQGRVAVLAHGYWQNALGGADVVGSSVLVNGQPLDVVGIAPAGFHGTTLGERADVFVPISLRWALEPNEGNDPDDRRNYWVYLFARLAPGVSMEQAEEQVNRVYAALLADVELPLQTTSDQQWLAQFRDKRIALSDGSRGQSVTAEQAATPLLLLLAAAALVLLVACLNIANLLLARGNARSAELAVRRSLGASRLRLLRQLLIEAVLIAAAGALLALPIGLAMVEGILGLMQDAGADGLQPGLDGAALRFALLTALATVLLFGLFPAWQATRTAPVAVLRSESGGSRGGRTALRFRNALATGQVAFSMAALVLAGLFLKSLDNLSAVDLGMDVERVLTFAVSPARNGYPPEKAEQFYREAERALAALPGVETAATSMVPLLTDSQWTNNITVQDREPTPQDVDPSYNAVGEHFFEAVGVPLLAGRAFDARDTGDGAKVVIVNRRFAELYGLGENPIGKRMAMGSGGPLDMEIVGLVADSAYNTVQDGVLPLLWVPRSQGGAPGSMNFYVRTAPGAQADVLARVPALVAGLDPDLPVEGLRSFEEQVALSLSMQRFVGAVAAAFAVLATLLAALGLHGVLSYTLSQRTRELGLRMALGAAPRRLVAMLFGQVGRMTLVGAVLGLLAAAALGSAAQTLLFGLQGHDPVVFLGALVLLVLVALAAAALPARRAARTDPMTALRHE